MKTISFQTRARTVDHLGREQIADVPTAISELWKNAYDAYAREVSLTIFDDEPLVITIADDGHGMTADEVADRWLTVGTESKLFEDTRSKQDRDGLSARSRQGQKGIGRLSSAHLGPLLLLLTKRRGVEMAAALIDWRLFENPFLYLSDIEIPVISVTTPSEVVGKIAEMAEALLMNVDGGGLDKQRSARIVNAWQAYDHATKTNAPDDQTAPPSSLIRTACRNLSVVERHLERWSAWTGMKDHGTAMVVSGASDEFSAFLPANKDLSASKADRERFTNTLGGFVDPLFDPAKPELNAAPTDFEYGVYRALSGGSEKVIGSDAEFNRALTDGMEHVVDGRIDEKGIFTGQVKSFGKWRKVGGEYVVPPPKDFALPTGRTSLLGPVDVYFATFEQELKNTTHTPQEFERLKKFSAEHGGLMIYRDGLRVLPYGREDNDFFEIEKRRSINAGREYWNARRIFGRIAISRANNPNLKDKAGREGFIVNKAAKSLKALVVNILKVSAYDYFGSNSDDRKIETDVTKRNFEEQKAKENQAKLKASNRKKFRASLKSHTAALPKIIMQVRQQLDEIKVSNADDIPAAQEKLEAVQAQFADLRLPGAPNPLGTLEDDYRAYRRSMTELGQLITTFSGKVTEGVERIDPAAPQDLLLSQIKRNESQLSSRVTRWSKEIRTLHDSERERITQLIGERNKLLRQETLPLVDRISDGRISLSAASQAVSEIKDKLNVENESLFQNYIFALENLRDSIDLQAVAVLGGDESFELRTQVDRLNGLAQLGITVEFLDHEFHSYDAAIMDGLRRLSTNINEVAALERLRTSYIGLKQIMDFLGPLRMAGRPEPCLITGQFIYDYVITFFERLIGDNKIDLVATTEFRKFSVVEQQARLLPVFINLVNNSLYWLVNSRTDSPRIILDIRSEQVFIADNGPGIEDIDVKRLFTLFFTRKSEGGRGVGLYLCQANLAAGGHSIHYVQDDDRKILPGANFTIKFRGARFDV